MQITPIIGADPHQSPVAQPRARGEGLLQVARSLRGTELRDLHQKGSTKLLFPRSHEGMTAVVLNSAGGVTGGDRFSLRAEAEAGAHLTLTTQAAERGYRAQPGEVGEISNMLAVAAGAKLHWLPQETILFDGAAVRRSLSVEMQDSAECLIVEPLILGRKAMGETIETLAFHDRIDIRRDGAPIYADRTRITGAALARSGPATLGACRAAVNVVFASPRAEATLPAICARLSATGPARGGASLIRPALLTCRIVAPTGYDLRAALVPLLETLTGSPLPRPWML